MIGTWHIPLLLLLGMASSSWHVQRPQRHAQDHPSGPVKEQAFAVLQTRCNVCHRTQNPKRIFTLDNMNDLAPRIHRQVFVWRTMPKGRSNELTPQERQFLRTWLDQQRTR